MPLSLNATAIKSYFQYRCERQLRYKMMGAEVTDLRIEKKSRDSTWGKYGIDFEKQVIKELSKTTSILIPKENFLTSDQSKEFLSQNSPYDYAHQFRLQLPNESDFFADLGVSVDFTLRQGFADLIQVVKKDDGNDEFKIIDIKATQKPTGFHKIQVAYYSLILERMLKALAMEKSVSPVGAIWHAQLVSGLSSVKWIESEFVLKGYQTQVLNFLQQTAHKVADLKVDGEIDETPFRIYFKCEQCEFISHCQKTIGKHLNPSDWDLSAVPGMTSETKRNLKNLAIHTVGDLARSTNVHLRPNVNWNLRKNGDVFTKRAQSICENKVMRLPNRYTYLMPDNFQLGIFLTLDHDPIEGRLSTIGLLEKFEDKSEYTIEVITEKGEKAERNAIQKVLSHVVKILTEVDEHNLTSLNNPIVAHIFFYEPSEIKDLQEALGRHLSDSGIRTGLLNILRMFPPEDFPIEPEYKGRQNLPGTALRSVIESLYALPVKVSHDLRTVTKSLTKTSKPLANPYVQKAAFKNSFSSRLKIDICSALKNDEFPESDVIADIKSRLLSISSLANWLVEENKNSENFLRLKKPPFRWQTTFDPLDVHNLDLLLAQELIESRTRELETLTALAIPWQQRRDQLKCFAQLRLLNQEPSPSKWAHTRLRFEVPNESVMAELKPGDFGLILTDDDPNLRLDPVAWQNVFVDLIDIQEQVDSIQLIIDFRKKGPVWNSLKQNTPTNGWFLDQAFIDINGLKMNAFLTYLGS